MARREAAVVNLTSLLALSPRRSAAVYCATKAALQRYTQALRYQLAAHPRERIVEVVPPLVDTAMTEGRGQGKISPTQAAAEIVSGLENEATEIYIGKARIVHALHRWAPSVVNRLLRDG